MLELTIEVDSVLYDAYFYSSTYRQISYISKYDKNGL